MLRFCSIGLPLCHHKENKRTLGNVRSKKKVGKKSPSVVCRGEVLRNSETLPTEFERRRHGGAKVPIRPMNGRQYEFG